MVQGFVRQGFWPRRAEAMLGTAAKQTVVLGRHPLASGVDVISTVGVALAYFFVARLSVALLEAVDGVALFWPVAGLIHRFCGSPFELNELRRVLALFAANVVGTSLSDIAGMVGFVLFQGSP